MYFSHSLVMPLFLLMSTCGFIIDGLLFFFFFFTATDNRPKYPSVPNYSAIVLTSHTLMRQVLVRQTIVWLSMFFWKGMIWVGPF